jgi:hypothetical protein
MDKYKIGAAKLALGLGSLTLGALAVLSACSGSAKESQQLSCNGNITPFLTNEKRADVAANQSIEVLIRKQRISFTGNSLLSGKDVAICPPGNSGWADGGHYFDSEACTSSPRKNGVRVYGTYNELSGSLDLTNEVAGSKYELVQGSFSCAKPAASKS